MFSEIQIIDNALGGILMQNNIKKWRDKIGKTQEELADYMNVSVPTVSRWETGVNDVTLTRLKNIAEYFNITVPELLSDLEDITRFFKARRISENMDKDTYNAWIEVGNIMQKKK